MTITKSSKSFDPVNYPLCNDGVNSYCKKYNMAKMPDEVFKDDAQADDKIYSEEIKEIEKENMHEASATFLKNNEELL